MQNTKNSTEVQGTGTAQEQLSLNLTEKTKKLFNWIDVDTIKNDVNNLLLGWVSGDAMQYFNSEDRIATFYFFTELINHLEITNKRLELNSNSIIPIECYDLFSKIDKNRIELCFKRTLVAYLESDFADDKTNRTNVIYTIEKTQEYIKKTYKLYSTYKLQSS